MESKNYKGLRLFLNIYGVISILLFGSLIVLTTFNASIIQEGGAMAMMRWMPFSPMVEIMLETVYFVWGIYFFVAARKPLQNISFINFTIWANLVHGLLMLVQVFIMPMYMYKVFTDIAYCLVLAIGLWMLKPKGSEVFNS